MKSVAAIWDLENGAASTLCSAKHSYFKKHKNVQTFVQFWFM
jgi:hypothetical protein